MTPHHAHRPQPLWRQALYALATLVAAAGVAAGLWFFVAVFLVMASPA